MLNPSENFLSSSQNFTTFHWSYFHSNRQMVLKIPAAPDHLWISYDPHRAQPSHCPHSKSTGQTLHPTQSAPARLLPISFHQYRILLRRRLLLSVLCFYCTFLWRLDGWGLLRRLPECTLRLIIWLYWHRMICQCHSCCARTSCKAVRRLQLLCSILHCTCWFCFWLHPRVTHLALRRLSFNRRFLWRFPSNLHLFRCVRQPRSSFYAWSSLLLNTPLCPLTIILPRFRSHMLACSRGNRDLTEP